MSKKYHINPKTGVPTICRAKKGKCPYQGAFGTDNHYDTYSEAQAVSLEYFRTKYNFLHWEGEEKMINHTLSQPYDEQLTEAIKGGLSSEIEKDADVHKVHEEIMNCKDSDKLMRIINGIEFPDMDWTKVGIALQNPNLPEEFMRRIVDYTDNFHIETVRLFIRNHAISGNVLISIGMSEDDDMLVRCLAFQSPAIGDDYAKYVLKNHREELTELPWLALVENKYLEEGVFDEFKQTQEYADTANLRKQLHEDLNRYPQWWIRYGIN